MMISKFSELIIANGAWKTILVGLIATIRISFFALIMGTILGMLIGIIRISKSKIFSKVAGLYIAFIRGIPVLMFLMLMYYVIFAKSSLDAECVAIITFGLNTAAYVAELIRTAIMATNSGEVEAARTLGFSAFDSFRLITLPQAITIAKPVYESTIVNLVQWTSVVGYVTITDLTRVINNMSARTMQPVFMIVTGMLLYLAIAYLVRFIFFLSNLKDREVGA